MGLELHGYRQMMVNTKKAPRRQLRFETLDDLLAELDHVEIAERGGTLRTTGNWTHGQLLAHLSAWIEYGWDGYPMKPAAWPIRWFLRRMLPGMLRKGMAVGVRIPGMAAGTTGADSMDTLAAIDRLRAAVKRLSDGEPVRFESPAFGPINQADRVRLQLRHAELHLSFLAFEP